MAEVAVGGRGREPRRRWVALLTNRVHPTRHGGSAEAIKALRRAVNDAALDLLDGAAR